MTIQATAVYVLWRREMTRYFRAKSRIFGSLAMPVFFLAFLGLGFRRMPVPGMDAGTGYIGFLAPGIIGMTLLFSSSMQGMSLLWDKEFGFLKEIMVAPVSQYPPAWYTEGAKIITATHNRTIPAAKSIDYTRAILVLAEARRKGAIEVVYVDSLGRVREGTTSNLFLFQGDTLVTPGENILPGITRQKVLELADGRFPVQIRDIPRAELSSADEAFITSSNRKPVPIVQVDKRTIGAGTPGPRTRALMQAYEEFTTRLSSEAA